MSSDDPTGRGLVDRLRRAGCVFAEREAAALCETFGTRDELERAVRRREAGVPLEHVLGYAELAGIRVVVTAPVFIPRRRTEWLVNRGVSLLLTGRAVGPVLDLGCGSGALAAAVRHRVPTVEVLATDSDEAAVACARSNGKQHGFAVYRGNWFEGLPSRYRRGLGLVVAYLPHVPTEELVLLPGDNLRAEPTETVDGGPDGLGPLRRVLEQLDDWLADEGRLLTLLAAGQVEAASELATSGSTGRRWTIEAAVREGDAVLGIGRVP